MAKKKKVNGLSSIILVLYGVALFGLGFIPCYMTVFKQYILDTVSKSAVSFYEVLTGIFENGFGEGEMLCIQIGVILYFVVAILAVVLGLLALANVLKGKGIGVIVYGLGLVATVMILVTVLVLNGNYATVIPEISKRYLTTWVYVQVGLSLAGLVYGCYKLKK